MAFKFLFLCICNTSILETLWEKGKLLVKTNFSFSRSIFYPFGNLSAIFIEIKDVVADTFNLKEYSRIYHLGKSYGPCNCLLQPNYLIFRILFIATEWNF